MTTALVRLPMSACPGDLDDDDQPQPLKRKEHEEAATTEDVQGSQPSPGQVAATYIDGISAEQHRLSGKALDLRHNL